jgi:hypothetical protein
MHQIDSTSQPYIALIKNVKKTQVIVKSQVLVMLWLCANSIVGYAEQYQSRDDFLQQAFVGTLPKANILWLKKPLKKVVKDILQHPPGFIRTRYWQQDDKTVWILNEIGKVKLITVGVVIQAHKIQTIKVLAFRESRGWEVKHPFFTDQFKQRTLTQDLKLDKSIDGISGATLSVRALNKIARMALFFDRQVMNGTH